MPDGSSPITGVFQHPRDLVLAAGAESLDTAGLIVLCGEVLPIGLFTLHVRIIGESHWVRVERAGVVAFQEVLACTAIDPARAVVHHAFSDMAAFEASHDGYSVRVDFADVPRPDWHPPADPASASGTLALDFPPTEGHIPMTRLHWQHDGECLRWWTLHTYPHEDRVTHVYSQSEWICA